MIKMSDAAAEIPQATPTSAIPGEPEAAQEASGMSAMPLIGTSRPKGWGLSGAGRRIRYGYL